MQLQLRRKEKKACENVRTFAETVKYRYPPSLAVIDANERNNNGFFFKNLPPQQIPIEKSSSGRWKFKRKQIIQIYIFLHATDAILYLYLFSSKN